MRDKKIICKKAILHNYYILAEISYGVIDAVVQILIKKN